MRSAASRSSTKRPTSPRTGKRLLVTHGDLFDGVIRHAKWLAHLGDTLYTLRPRAEPLRSTASRVRMGFGYWSLSQYLKHKVKNAVALHRRLRARADQRGAATRLRRRGLRPHPQGGDTHDRRHPVLQRRRLGREPDRARRRPRGPARNRRVEARSADAHAAASAMRAPHEDPDRHRRLGAAGQRRGPDAEVDASRAREDGSRRSTC